MVVAGGGSSGKDGAGGGGGGGFREGLGQNDSYTGSPLRNPSGLPVSATTYPITVGAGGTGAANNDNTENNINPQINRHLDLIFIVELSMLDMVIPRYTSLRCSPKWKQLKSQ